MPSLITDVPINGYFITAEWGARGETPGELAKRIFLMLEAFRQIDPVLSDWIYGRSSKLDMLDERLVKFIAKEIERDDFGVATPEAGYWFCASSPHNQAADRRFVINSHLGSSLNRRHANYFVCSESTQVKPAPETHARAVFHPALLAIVAAWDPVTVEANCLWLGQRETIKRPFRIAWMRYLCPSLARQANLPASAIVEHLPNGGLLLSATDQTFDVDNPKHVAVAEEIAAALEPLAPKLG